MSLTIASITYITVLIYYFINFEIPVSRTNNLSLLNQRTYNLNFATGLPLLHDTINKWFFTLDIKPIVLLNVQDIASLFRRKLQTVCSANMRLTKQLNKKGTCPMYVMKLLI